MEMIHIRDRLGAPACGQSQAYRTRPIEEWVKLPQHQTCKRCRRMKAAEIDEAQQRVDKP